MVMLKKVAIVFHQQTLSLYVLKTLDLMEFIVFACKDFIQQFLENVQNAQKTRTGMERNAKLEIIHVPRIFIGILNKVNAFQI